MMHVCQCAHCGEVFTMIAPKIYAGIYPCPMCTECAIFIPVTNYTPHQDDCLEIEDKCVEPTFYHEDESIRDFALRSDDFAIMTRPHSN